METGLQNRVALITGSSQGMGRATALAFAAEGAKLALCARNPQPLEQLAREIEQKYHVEVFTKQLDVRDSAAEKEFIEEAARRFRRLDICVTNAGGPPAKQFLETADGDWDDAFRLNLRSTASLARAVIPIMQRARWGRIITITSITVKQPQTQLILSNSIRTGIVGLVRSLANEFGKDGILVNNVAPGYTATERLSEVSEKRAETLGRTKQEVEQTWIAEIPLGRLAKPEEVADTIVWLASERASFITGQTILVDGGLYKGL